MRLECLKEFRIINGDIADTVDAVVEWLEEIKYKEKRDGDSTLCFVGDYTSKTKTLDKGQDSGHQSVFKRFAAYGISVRDNSTRNELNKQAVPFLASIVEGKIKGANNNPAEIAGYDIKFVLDSGCTYMIRDFRKSRVNTDRVIDENSTAKYKPRPRSNEGVEEAGHGIDTAKYIVLYLYRKEYERRYRGGK